MLLTGRNYNVGFITMRACVCVCVSVWGGVSYKNAYTSTSTNTSTRQPKCIEFYVCLTTIKYNDLVGPARVENRSTE